MEPAQQLHHRLFRHQNLLASPLFRLPTELVLKIFEHAVEPDNNNLPSPRSGPTLLVLTAICHELQNIGRNTPLLWSTIDSVLIKTLTTRGNGRTQIEIGGRLSGRNWKVVRSITSVLSRSKAHHRSSGVKSFLFSKRQQIYRAPNSRRRTSPHRNSRGTPLPHSPNFPSFTRMDFRSVGPLPPFEI